MKINSFIYILFFVAFVLFVASSSFAQDAKAPGTPNAQHTGIDRPRDLRADLLHSLGLSAEQLEQIRQINMARKPLMDEAQKRLRQANRFLDAAIYADLVNDADVDARLKEVQTAQAEVAEIRFRNELAVRRVLTPEQLTRFREMRQRFEEARKNFQNQRSLDNLPAHRRMRGGAPVDPQPARPVLPPDSQRANF
jgi:Spy/CpxP family protein refolding chaperone